MIPMKCRGGNSGQSFNYIFICNIIWNNIRTNSRFYYKEV